MERSKLVRAMASLLLGENSRRQGGICGQAFSEYNCALCGNKEMHHNTATPLVCGDCKKGIIGILNEPTSATRGGEG